jgi:general secretion pathway protein M
MAITLNRTQGRRLALAILFGAIALIVVAIAVPVWLLNRHYDNALHDAYDKVERYRRIASMRPEITRQLEAMRARDPRKFFLRSGASSLSAAEAQEALRSIVESNGGRLITMQAPSSKDEGRYRRITVNVQLTANIFALRKILHAIESNTPFLFADNLMVRSQVPGNFRPAPGAEPEMFVQLDVSGYAFTGT